MGVTSSTAAIRVGVVGGGMWAREAHIPLHRTPGPTELTAVWTRSDSARAELEAEGIPTATSFDALLEISEAVDFAVPPTAQPALALRAAQAGRHLMLEKPIAIDLVEARHLAAVVREAGVVSTMLLTRRFHPVVRAVLDVASASRREVIGLQGAHVHGGFLFGGFIADRSSWRTELGVLLDLGPHLLDLAEQLAGPIERVRTREHRGWVAVEATHRHGAIGQYAMSGGVDTVAGTTLSALAPSGRVTIETAGLDMAPAFRAYREEFALAVRSGGPVTVDAARGAELSALIDACRRSADAQGEIVTVSTEGIAR